MLKAGKRGERKGKEREGIDGCSGSLVQPARKRGTTSSLTRLHQLCQAKPLFLSLSLVLSKMHKVVLVVVPWEGLARLWTQGRKKEEEAQKKEECGAFFSSSLFLFVVPRDLPPLVPQIISLINQKKVISHHLSSPIKGGSYRLPPWPRPPWCPCFL
jgi:hypothetical protein